MKKCVDTYGGSGNAWKSVTKEDGRWESDEEAMKKEIERRKGSERHERR